MVCRDDVQGTMRVVKVIMRMVIVQALNQPG